MTDLERAVLKAVCETDLRVKLCVCAQNGYDPVCARDGKIMRAVLNVLPPERTPILTTPEFERDQAYLRIAERGHEIAALNWLLANTKSENAALREQIATADPATLDRN